jgi:signal transduction histidine kinase
MLILAKLMADNTGNNLTPRQIEFAQTIYQSGGDLLNLINEILDLSKVEAGRMDVEVSDVPLAEVQEYVARTFEVVAEEKGLEFLTEIAPDVPETIATDMQRLQQVLRNLLGNAFKFTEQGRVELTIRLADPVAAPDGGTGSADGREIAFTVRDTGVGIPADKQSLIFEAFQQADGTTSRKYGGRASGCPSAARSRGCSAAGSTSRARRAGAARLPCFCRRSTMARSPRRAVRARVSCGTNWKKVAVTGAPH